jgi:hypothetical protein
VPDRFKTLTSGFTLALLLGAPAAFAQFAPGPNPIGGTSASPVTAAQTITTGTGTVNGFLQVSGSSNSGVAITVKGSSSIINNGTIEQTDSSTTGNGRAIRDNTGNLTLTVTNNAGALIQTNAADAFQMNVAGSTVTLNNYGTINSLNQDSMGNQAIDWNALNSAVGSNTLNNYST